MPDQLTPFPIRTMLYQTSDLKPLWIPNPVIYLLLDGTASLAMAQDTLLLPKNRVQLVSPYIVHSITCSGMLLQITLDISYFEHCLSKPLHHNFFCSAASETDRDIKASLRHALVQYILVAQKPSGFDAEAAAWAFHIMDLLQSSFVLLEDSSDQTPKSSLYLSKAIDYMNLNFASIRFASEIAAHCHIAESYMSRLFKEYTGISTAAYLERIRLGHACSMLSGSRTSITEIAHSCGFPSSRSLSDSFQRQFGMLPSEFRRQPIMSPAPFASNELTSLLLPLAALPSPSPESREVIQFPFCSFYQPGSAIDRSFFRTLNIGPVSRMFTHKIQQILNSFDMFGFQYAYITDLMHSDAMPSLCLDDGSIQYSFVKIDEALDLLLSHKLTPFLNVDTAIPLLSTQNNKTYSTQAEKIWLDRLYQLFTHLIHRYGIDCISAWRFTAFIYPYEPAQFQTGQGIPALNRLFLHAIQVIKTVHPLLSLYAPPFYSPYSRPLLYALESFLSQCGSTLPPALLFYVPPVLKDDTLLCCHPSYDELQILLDSVHPIIHSFYNGHTDIHVVQWMPFSNGRNYLSDTIATVPYLARCFTRHHNHFSSVAYASISDYFDPFPDAKLEFYGFSGFLTRSGICKPSYFLLWILCHIQGEILCQGDGYFICRENDLLQIFFYNPNGIYARQDFVDFGILLEEHPSTKISQYFIKDEEKIMTTNNRYAVYEGISRVYRAILKDLKHPRYYFSAHYITRQKGNPFQTLLDNGGEEAARPWEIQNLRDNNTLGWYHQFIIPQNGEYQLEQRLEPNELMHIIISPKQL